MKKYIKFKLWKFSLLQASVPPVFIFAFNAYTGFEIPIEILLGFSLSGSAGFSIVGAAIAAMALESVLTNDELKNTFRPLSHGSVKLSNAKRAFSIDFIFVVLKDTENGSVVRIPRPFWADDPILIKAILNKVDNKPGV